jgi:pseudaminic acid synthase
MNSITIAGRKIGPTEPVYVIAEVSANHNQDFDQAVRLLEVAKESGADAVKIQTYTADTITLNAQTPHFQVGGGTIWDGRTLYDLYQEAYTPWDWQPKLKAIADQLGITLFSSPFDHTAVDFLETMQVPAYKVASFELVDLPLLRKIASTGKPVIASTGMASLAEIDEAVRTLREAGATEIALLRTNSGYPAPPEEMHLRTIPHLAQAFDLPTGLSDHTLGISASVAAVALGACILEKHITLSRSEPGPDSAFSLEPDEFAAMIAAVRETEKLLGQVHYGVSAKEKASRVFRRSLFVTEAIKAGEPITLENVRSVRPAHGLHTRYLEQVIGRVATRDLEMGTPLSWDVLG